MEKVAAVEIHAPRPRLQKWERRLPQRLVIAAEPSARSLSLRVELESTSNGTVVVTDTLVDSGATSMGYADQDFVVKNNIPVRTLLRPIPVFNVDGTANEAGSITEIVDTVLRYRHHSERIQLAVTRLGKHSMILGHGWLREHNPEVDWTSGEVSMSRCPARCAACRESVKKDRNEQKANERRKEEIRSGPLPKVTVEDITEEEEAEWADLEEEFEPPSDPHHEDSLPDPDSKVEDGDRVFMTSLAPQAEFIHTSTTVSQRLSEAHAKANAQPLDGLPSHFYDYRDIFEKESFDVLPDRKLWDHAIELVPEAETSKCKVYPMSPIEQKALDEFIMENLATGRIRPSKSPMASPVFFVKKKDGSLCLVQDYRKLNAYTVKNRYPPPLINDLINRLKGARYFTKLDVRWGFNNVRIREGDEWKAAFRTNRGLFEPLVMFFGLTNSPATFQTMMNDIFQDLIADGVVCVYLDDILIFTKTLEEHRRITRIVLDRLREHKLFLRADKCEFEKTEIEYLGVIISHNEVRMDPVKVAGVADWPTPTSRKEVSSFLGFLNFYRRFVEGFSKHARPLFNLLQQSRQFSWGKVEANAFELMKTLVTSAPVLIMPDDSKPYRVEADSSDFATGCKGS